MPQYYDYYSQEPGDDAWDSLARGFAGGVNSGIERSLARKDKMKDAEMEFAKQGYRKAKPEDKIDDDTPKIEFDGATYIKPYTPTELADREYTKRERELKSKKLEAETKALEGGQMYQDAYGNWHPIVSSEGVMAGSKTKVIPYKAPNTLPAQKYEDLKAEKERALQEKSDFVKTQAQDALNTIAEVKKGIKHFGWSGLVPAFPSSEKKTWESNLKKLLSGQVINVMNEMKNASRTGASGFGQLSEKELAVLQQASTALSPTIAPEKAMELLNAMESAINQKVFSGGQSGQPQPMGGQAQPMYAVNPQTQERIMSLDGGQTWQPAQ